AIGGSRERRGVISTANYPARQFGVRSAMPTAMALKLCPHLTLLPGRFDAYKEAPIVPVKVTVPVLLPAALAKLETPITSAAATAVFYCCIYFSSLLKSW
ncbi:DNA polymerase IV, partial [Salmonella enterica subsp. enterica serovar Soerenga]